MNIDYSVCHAFGQFKHAKRGALMYDVFCQWIKYFFDRVHGSNSLNLPEDFELVGGVGKFHLGAHIKECFYQYSLNFLPHIGQVDGEIMETIWALLNRIASLTRAMTKAYRQEVIDDMIRDINWKKLVASGEGEVIGLFISDCSFSSVTCVKMGAISDWRKGHKASI
jgi:Kyakuja-Dileera-Zisupton transposase